MEHAIPKRGGMIEGKRFDKPVAGAGSQDFQIFRQLRVSTRSRIERTYLAKRDVQDLLNKKEDIYENFGGPFNETQFAR